MNNVYVLLSNLTEWKPYCYSDSIVTVSEYLEHHYADNSMQLVINLANDYSYNSEGYYCSLLAQARGHRVIPSVETLNKIESETGIRLPSVLQKQCYQYIRNNNLTDNWLLNIYFGNCREKGLEKIARFIFDNYPSPLLQITFNANDRNQIETVRTLSLSQLKDAEQDIFADTLDKFSKKVWRSPRGSKSTRYSIAILHDPEEKFPPSDKQAIKKFLEIAKRMNIHAELVTEEDMMRLMEFDGLFIRTTTSLNHYTYHWAQKAAANGIVVIDDPQSIIRCTNKVYLCELFEKEHIAAPSSMLLFRSEKNSYDDVCARIGSPFIIKTPDGSFSIGMRKVSDAAEFEDAVNSLFAHSAILLAQEFMPTEFDWRIGILDGEPLFACKYYMAKGHWQIYNHDVTGKNLCGPWETIPIYQVPVKVRDLALKAAALIGKGLYGVDLKVVDGKPKIIEINDNPNIDHEVEDAVMGDEIYYRILHSFVKKLNRMHATL